MSRDDLNSSTLLRMAGEVTVNRSRDIVLQSVSTSLEGQGKLVTPLGNIYEGQWDCDRANGHGTYFNRENGTYSGRT